jgi:predicted DNA-binding ribbon-helix-helix protein
VPTTVRLENPVLGRAAGNRARENLTTSQFAVKLYDKQIGLRGEPPTNFASFLRVCCLRYLSLQTAKEEATAALVAAVSGSDLRLRFLKTV